MPLSRLPEVEQQHLRLEALRPEGTIMVEGELATYEQQATVGVSAQQVCSSCYTLILRANDAALGWIVIHAGTLHDSHQLGPAAHIWTSRMQR